MVELLTSLYCQPLIAAFKNTLKNQTNKRVQKPGTYSFFYSLQPCENFTLRIDDMKYFELLKCINLLYSHKGSCDDLPAFKLV